MSAIDIFTRLPVDYNLPKGVEHHKYEYQLELPENRSLMLAERESFGDMCADILWGSEDLTAFGEMLRGLVLTFLPKNRLHLELLRNVAHCQWNLRRIGSVQKNLFEHGKESRGEYGLPTGTVNAVRFRPENSDLLKDLERAVNIYQKVRGKI